MQRFLRIHEATHTMDHPDVAEVLGGLAWIEMCGGNFGKAELLCRRAIVILEKTRGPDHEETVEARRVLEDICAKREKKEPVDTFFVEALQDGEPPNPETDAMFEQAIKKLEDRQKSTETVRAETTCHAAPRACCPRRFLRRSAWRNRIWYRHRHVVP